VKLVIMPLIVYGLCVGIGPQSALHDCRSRLCRRTDREDGVYPGRRVQGWGTTGRRHGLDHDAAVGPTLLGWLYALSGLAPRAG